MLGDEFHLMNEWDEEILGKDDRQTTVKGEASTYREPIFDALKRLPFL